MSNVVQAKIKQKMLEDLLSAAAVKLVLIDAADYTWNAAHDFLDDIPAGARVGISAALAGKTFTDGAFDSDPAVFTSLTGDPVEEGMLFIDTGSAATSRLIARIDTFASGMPFSPTGGNVNVTPEAAGWFTL